MTVQFTPDLREQYQMLWDSCEPRGSLDTARAIADKLQANAARYAAVTAVVNPAMPWHFVGLVHLLECSQRFDSHLHNGDPLTARTTHVPMGRPVDGVPPFQWEHSAIDALSFQGLRAPEIDWTLPGELYQLERYNGFGYRKHGVLTPYLWSGTNHYTSGKFVSDGLFDKDAVSKQIGAAVILRCLVIPEKQST